MAEVEWNTAAPFLGESMSDARRQFERLVTDLVRQVNAWAGPADWTTQTYPKRMRDSNGSVFEVPALRLQKGPTRVLLDPIAYDVPGADAVVDLYLMPTYDDLASLYHRPDGWEIQYLFPDDPVRSTLEEAEALPLDQAALLRVLDAIAAHATPSV
jgi:hypothetical protein